MNITKEAVEAGVSILREASRTTGKINETVAAIAEETVDDLASAAQARTIDLITAVRNAVEAGAGSLRRDGYYRMGDLVDRMAGATESLEEAATRTEVSQFANQMRSAIRDKPALVLGGLAATGFLAAVAMQIMAQAETERKAPARKKARASARKRGNGRSKAASGSSR